MEIDYNALFGVGVEAQEPAEPASAEQSNEGVEAQEPAEPAVESEPTEESVGETPAEAPVSVGKTEEDSKFAEARRKAEADKKLAVTQAREEAEKQASQRIFETLKRMNIVDPDDGSVIDSVEKLEAWEKKAYDRKVNASFEQAGIDKDAITALIGQHPDVVRAKEAAERFQAAEKTAKESEAKARLENELSEIRKLDPNIKTFSDLTNHPAYDRIYKRVSENRLSILDAFRLEAQAQLIETAQKQAAQEVMSKASSKAHLAPLEGRGEGALSVPRDIMAQYKLFNPNMSEAEITKHYNKQMKGR